MEIYFLLLLVILMSAALASGYPVAFALPGSAILTIGAATLCGWLFAGDAGAYFAQGGPVEWLSAGVTNLRGVYWEVERDTLIAIPLFVFMGIMLQRSKIAEDLLVTMAQLFGPIPGGLGISVVFVGALLAATTGIVGATVVAMGLISLPAMLRNNYSHSLATGTIAASGTLGQIIPPSIVLIILADQLASAVDQASTLRKTDYKAATGDFALPSEFDVSSTSAGEMFLGAFIPGLVLVGIYMVYILTLSLIRPKMAPAVAFEGTFDRKFAGRVLLILVPPLALIFLVLGSIITGIATVNQAGAIGAAGALIMAGYRLKEGEKGAYTPTILAVLSIVAIVVIIRTFDTNIRSIDSASDVMGVTLAAIAVGILSFSLVWSGWRAYKIEDTLRGVMVDTAKTTSLVFIILLGAAMLTAAFRAFGGEELVKEFLTGLPGGFWGQFFIVMLVIFILGFFLDFIEIAVVVVPIVAPILLADPSANITAVWLGVMIGLNIQTSFLTPPFGFALFYLRGVAPSVVRTISMYKGVVAFISLQLIALVIVGLSPGMVNYLPNRLSLTSETAPPPLNPRLQYCVEQYVHERFQADGDAIRTAIADASTQDVSYLPKKLQRSVTQSFAKAGEAFELLDNVFATEAAMNQGAIAYRPLHRQVRGIERDIRRHEAEIEELETQKRRSRDDAEKERLQARIEKDKGEIEQLKTQMPANWADARKAFTKLLDDYKKARTAYQRNVDQAYAPIKELTAVLADTDKLAGFLEPLNAMKSRISSGEPKAVAEEVQQLSRQIRTVEGAGAVRSELSKVRRAMRAKTPDPAKAAEAIDKAIAAFTAELEWRKKAEAALKPAIARYDVVIRDTIGLRQLSRLPEEQALYIAGCNAGHRDISLNF